jgi:hypothetical protein
VASPSSQLREKANERADGNNDNGAGEKSDDEVDGKNCSILHIKQLRGQAD